MELTYRGQRYYNSNSYTAQATITRSSDRLQSETSYSCVYRGIPYQVVNKRPTDLRLTTKVQLTYRGRTYSRLI